MVVVGEFLGEEGLGDAEAKGFAKGFAAPSTTAAGRRSQLVSVADFNVAQHRLLDTRASTRIMAVKLEAKRMNVYLLAKKKNGLCETA